jgi:hypothetical protein
MRIVRVLVIPNGQSPERRHDVDKPVVEAIGRAVLDTAAVTNGLIGIVNSSPESTGVRLTQLVPRWL